MKKILLLLTVLPILGLPGYAQELLYPSGANIDLTYSINQDRITLDDTLIVNRTISNNDIAGLSKLYISENVPDGFELVSIDFSTNGSPLTQVDSIELSDHILPGYINYSWVFNSDGNLAPGDSLHLVYKLTPSELGDYLLPLHTAVFESDGGQYFAYSESVSISVVLVLDTNDTDPILPTKFLVSNAYPNPFNGTIRIDFEGSGLASKEINFEIFNVLGRRIINEKIVAKAGKNAVYWNTGSGQTTGLYFYRITAGEQITKGKIVLLK